jgi:ABC-type transport system involved in multi-copper enzyme maturation permease subunit
MTAAAALVRADVLKVQRRRGVWFSTILIPAAFVLLVGMLGAFISDLGVAGGGAFTDDAQFTVGLMTSVIAALLGARLGADEHVAQTFRYQVLSGRPRAQLYASKIGALIAIMTIAVLVATVVTVVASYLPKADPDDTVTLEDLLTLFWNLWLPAIVYGTISLGVGSMMRATGGAIATALVLQFVGLNLLALLTEIWTGFKYVVVGAALDRLGPDTIDNDDKLRLAFGGAIVCLVVWLAIFIAAGLLRTLRSED